MLPSVHVWEFVLNQPNNLGAAKHFLYNKVTGEVRNFNNIPHTAKGGCSYSVSYEIPARHLKFQEKE